MADNFYRTAERSMNAAVALDLHASDHSHFACYLSGYVVECAGKEIVMRVFGETSHTVAKIFSHNLVKIDQWLRFIAANPSAMPQIPPGCWPEFHVDAKTILHGPHEWNPFYRYSDPTGWDAPQRAIFVAEAQRIMQKLSQLVVAGII